MSRRPPVEWCCTVVVHVALPITVKQSSSTQELLGAYAALGHPDCLPKGWHPSFVTDGRAKIAAELIKRGVEAPKS